MSDFEKVGLELKVQELEEELTILKASELMARKYLTQVFVKMNPEDARNLRLEIENFLVPKEQ